MSEQDDPPKAQFWEADSSNDPLPIAGYIETSEDRQCGQQREGWECARTTGHDGRHIACGSERVLAAWPGREHPVSHQ